MDDYIGCDLNGELTYNYNKHVTLTISGAVFWPGDGAEVVAQCFNAGPKCGDGTLTNDRADDEAINTEVELLIEY